MIWIEENVFPGPGLLVKSGKWLERQSEARRAALTFKKGMLWALKKTRRGSNVTGMVYFLSCRPDRKQTRDAKQVLGTSCLNYLWWQKQSSPKLVYSLWQPVLWSFLVPQAYDEQSTHSGSQASDSSVVRHGKYIFPLFWCYSIDFSSCPTPFFSDLIEEPSSNCSQVI